MTFRRPEWLTRLAGPHVLSWPAWLLVCVPSIMSSFIYLTSQASMGRIAAWAWGAVSCLAMGLTWLLASKTWMRGGSLTRRAALILPTYALAAIVRSAVTIIAGGPTSGANPIPFSVLATTILSVAATLVVQSYRELTAQNGRLTSIRDALAASETSARAEAHALRASSRQAIVAAIERAIAEDAQGEDTSLRLRRVSDDVVRPLSHALSLPHDEDPPLAEAPPRGDLPGLARAILAGQPIRPFTIASLIVIMTFGAVFMVYGTVLAVVPVAVLWLVLVLLLWTGRLVPWHRFPVMLGIPALCLTFVFIGLLASTVRLVVGPLASQFPSALDGVARGQVLMSLTAVVAGGVVAALAGVLQQQKWMEESLITEGERLIDARRASQAQLRRDRSHLARILHGVVQPRIVARAMRLQGTSGSIDVEELAQEISALIGNEPASADTIEASRALRDIAEAWTGSRSVVSLTSPPRLDEVLAAHPSVTQALVEVVREAVNNAILRAGATRIHVALTVDASDVNITVTNDVQVSTPHPTGPGLGSTLFDSLTDEWDLHTSEGQAEFNACISLPHRESTAIAAADLSPAEAS